MDMDNNSENISFLLNDEHFNKDSSSMNECELLELYKLQSELNDYETGVNYFGDESDNTDDIFTQMKLYELNYNVKQLMLICEFYNIKDVRVNKLKKQDIIEQIIFFENNPENIEIVNKRKEFWCHMDELKNDRMMKRFVIWS
uniref:Uncharacterized protein n=1 Tax=viral metagenome TaxID=1070528 RepID=A0A6C0DAY8_9ZZZZ